MALKRVNAVVVGSGAGGGVVAKELSEAGLSVVLLERGVWADTFEHFDDEFLGWSAELLGPDRRHMRVTSRNGKWVTIYPGDRSYCGNAVAVGGGTQFYGGMAWRNFPQDFRLRSTYGTVPGSSLEDWPISYDDLEPFYEKVEWEIGVSGDMRNCPQAPPQKRDYPMPAFPWNRAAEVIAAGGRKLGLHPISVPYLRNSIPYNDLPACQLRRLCAGYNCPIQARNGTQNTVIPRALATGLCELRTGAMAAEVLFDQRGHATGVRYFDSNDREQVQPADLVVLSAGATESARLLLNSRSRLFPNGAGNNNGWVGHNLHGHTYRSISGLWDFDLRNDHGPEACLAFLDYAHGNPGIIGGGLLDAPRGGQSPLRYARSLRGWGQQLKTRIKEYKRRCSVNSCVLDMPVFESRVELDPQVKDRWGIPVLRVIAKRHPNDFQVQNFLSRKGADVLRAAGASGVEVEDAPVPAKVIDWPTPHGQHQAGTCRMGNDPRTSVTNRYGQVHEIDNLFCADAGLHVANGCLNPAETIMALGYWVSDYIKREWKGTKFRAG